MPTTPMPAQRAAGVPRRATVCGPSSRLAPDGRSGNAQGTGSWTNPTTSSVYGVADVTATSNSQRTDVLTHAVLIR